MLRPEAPRESGEQCRAYASHIPASEAAPIAAFLIAALRAVASPSRRRLRRRARPAAARRTDHRQHPGQCGQRWSAPADRSIHPTGRPCGAPSPALPGDRPPTSNGPIRTPARRARSPDRRRDRRSGQLCRSFATTVNDARGIRRYRGDACRRTDGRWQLDGMAPDDAKLSDRSAARQDWQSRTTDHIGATADFAGPRN